MTMKVDAAQLVSAAAFSICLAAATLVAAAPAIAQPNTANEANPEAQAKDDAKADAKTDAKAGGKPIEITVRSSTDRFATRGSALITRDDVETYLAAQVPEDHRSAFLSDPDRVGKMLKNLAMPRQLANLAIAEELHLQPRIQAKMLQGLVTLLADEYVAAYAQRHTLDDYEAIAREEFLVSDKQVPSKLDFTQLLIAPEEGRLLEAMREIVELSDRLEGEPDRFEELVLSHSDDPALEDNQGQYKGFEPTELADPIRAALLDMDVGEISGPVQSRHGWHILRLDARADRESVKFEEVRGELVEKARNSHIELVQGRLLSELDHKPMQIEEGAVRELLESYDSRFGVFSSDD